MPAIKSILNLSFAAILQIRPFWITAMRPIWRSSYGLKESEILTNYENDNGLMPPPVGDRYSPGQSAGILPCRSKAQELRSSMSSNSLRFLTPGKAKYLIAFVS